MADLRAFLRDTGALVLSPLLVPGVRPLTKAALKGGMAVADVAKEAAESAGKQLRESVTEAREGLKKAPQPVAAEPVAPAPGAADAPQAADGVAPAAAESGLRPMAAAALKGAQSLVESAASFVSETGKQWSDIIADASAERKGGAAETPQAETPTGQAEATAAAAKAPAAAAPAAAATEAAQADASAAGETADSVARGLRPIVKSIMKGGMAFAESASDVASQASKQWSGIFADASAKQKADQRSDAAEAAQVFVEAPGVAAPVAAAVAAAPGTAHEADDLTQVNGIGPKAAALLNEAGITTFAQLAVLSTDQLRGILSKGGPRYRIVDPTPWPADARRLMEPVPAASVAIRDDDLVQVNGIGPKVAALLNEAGITTLTQLAATSTDQLRAILTTAGPRYRIVDPTPWPAEARRLLETRNG